MNVIKIDISKNNDGGRFSKVYFAHGSLSKFAEGMRRSRINVKKSRQNYDC